MEKSLKSFTDFTGTWNTDTPPLLLPDNSTPDCENVITDEGGIKPRGGHRLFANLPVDNQVIASHNFITETRLQRLIVATRHFTAGVADNVRIYKRNDDGSWTELTGASPNIRLHKDSLPTFATFPIGAISHCWITNRQDPIYYFNDGDTTLTEFLYDDGAVPSLRPGILLNHNRRLWAGQDRNFPSRLYYTSIDNPRDSTDRFENGIHPIGGPGDIEFIMGLYSFGFRTGRLLIFKETSTWLLSGFGISDWVLDKISSKYGCISHQTIVERRGVVYWLSREGLCSYDGNRVGLVDASRNITKYWEGLGRKSFGNKLEKIWTDTEDFEGGTFDDTKITIENDEIKLIKGLTAMHSSEKVEEEFSLELSPCFSQKYPTHKIKRIVFRFCLESVRQGSVTIGVRLYGLDFDRYSGIYTARFLAQEALVPIPSYVREHVLLRGCNFPDYADDTDYPYFAIQFYKISGTDEDYSKITHWSTTSWDIGDIVGLWWGKLGGKTLDFRDRADPSITVYIADVCPFEASYISPPSERLVIATQGVFFADDYDGDGSVSYQYACSVDGTTWSAWKDIVDGETWSRDVNGTPGNYIRWRATLFSAGLETPIIYGVKFTYYGSVEFSLAHNSIVYKDRIYTSIIKKDDVKNTDILVLDKTNQIRKYTGLNASTMVILDDKLLHGKAEDHRILEYDETFLHDMFYNTEVVAFWEIPAREWALQRQKILRYLMATFQKRNQAGRLTIEYTQDEDAWLSERFNIRAGTDIYNHKIVPKVKRGIVYRFKIKGTKMWKLVSFNPLIFIYPLQPAKFTRTQIKDGAVIDAIEGPPGQRGS